MKITDNPTCQHFRVDNEAGKCVACDEQMIAWTREAETVLSAPNAAACTNPACKEAVANGTYDDTNPPAGCTNPDGVYVEGYPAREVVVGYKVTYECERCRNGDTLTITPHGMTWGCGRLHRGDMIRVKANA